MSVTEAKRAVAGSAWTWALSLAALIALLVGGAWLAWRVPLNHDVAWGFYSAGRVLDGAQPYVDFVETNPPLFIYLSVPLEWLARTAHWTESSVLVWFVLGITLAALHQTDRVLRLEPGTSTAVRIAAALGMAYASLVLPGLDVGQREHQTFILILPCCALCAVRAASDREVPRSLWLPVAAMASVGILMKPHFVAVWGALACFVALMRRRPWLVCTPENRLVGVAAVGYASAMLLFTPQYLTSIVPQVARTYEPAYAQSTGALLADSFILAHGAGALLLLLFAGRLSRDRVASAWVRVLALASLVFLAVYVVQAKGYYYHQFPAVACNLMAFTIAGAAFGRSAALRTPEQTPWGGTRLAWRVLVLLVAAIPVVVALWKNVNMHATVARLRANGMAFGVFREPFVDLVRQKAEGRPIFVLSTSVAPAFPLVNLSGATWPYRYNCLWPLPVHYRDDRHAGRARYRSPAVQSPSERAFFDDVVRQLRETPPVLLIVDRQRLKQGFGMVFFDYLEYFGQSPAFAALLQEYRPLIADGPYAVYERRSTAHAGSQPTSEPTASAPPAAGPGTDPPSQQPLRLPTTSRTRS